MKHFNSSKRMFLLLCIMLGVVSAQAQMSGTYTVGGTNPDYTTLAAAVSDLTSSGVSGAVVLNVRDGSYSGTGWQVSIGNITGASATNTITIKSQSNDASKVTISAAGSSANNHVILFDGAKYVKVRYLSLTNTNTSYGSVVRFNGTAEFNNVENCILTSPTTTSSSGNMAVVNMGNASLGSYFPGGSITIKSNAIKNGSIAVSLAGTSTSTLSDDNIFDGNTITGSYYYVFFTYYAGNMKVINNTINVSSSGLYSVFYCYYNGDGMEISNNTGAITTSNTHYLFYNVYTNYYVGSATTPVLIKNNDMSVSSTTTLYGVYNLYNYFLDFSDNNLSATSTGTTYMPYYFLYYCENSKATGNEFSTNNTTSTTYCPYAVCYYSNNCEVSDNKFTAKATTGTVYSPYYGVYYGADNVVEDNEFICDNTTGTMYLGYYVNGYGTGNIAKGNTFTGTKASGTTYAPYFGVYGGSANNTDGNTWLLNASGSSTVYAPYYINYYGSADTFQNNTIDINTTGTIYSYKYYLTDLSINNTFNFNTTSGSIYNYFYYSNGGTFANNRVNMTTTTGAIYGAYPYSYNTSGNKVLNNIFDCRSTSGTIYGFYGYYQNGDDWVGNIISTKTTGTSYLFYASSGMYADTRFYNNTFHSNATGSTNYLMYFSGSNSGKGIFKNNVFSRTNTASAGVYISDAAMYEGDYNNFYSGTSTAPALQCGNPSFTTTQLQEWRQKTGSDMNSLSFDPGYVSAANFDFRPDASNPSSWSLQGRGVHLDGDTLDIVGNPRAKVPADGVPDLGAYEFTPTSIPYDAVAVPASPVANSTQYFLFGQDTVGSIDWGANVPTSFSMKQYTGLQANPIISAVGRMFFFTTTDAGGDVAYAHKAHMRYKNPWIGNISSETNARIAKSTGSTPWAGYNFTNGITDTVMNDLAPAANFDSIGSYTGVENARIGIRCVVAPENIVSSNITAYVADIAWDPIFNPTGYQILVNTVKATPTQAQAASANFTATNSYTAGVPTALTEDTKYYIHVRSICGAKDTSGWALDSFTTLIRCHAPDVKITAITSNRAVAYWDTIKTGISYEYAVSQSPTPPSSGTAIPNNSLLVPYLLDNTTYYMHVKTRCNSMYNESGWKSVPFTTWPLNVEGVSGGVVSIAAYPNPAKDYVKVMVLGADVDGAVVTIADVSGRVVMSSSIAQKETVLDVKHLPSGVYVLNYINGSQTQRIKLVKE